MYVILFSGRTTKLCENGGIGRRTRLRGVWETVWVQVPFLAPTKVTSFLVTRKRANEQRLLFSFSPFLVTFYRLLWEVEMT